MKNFSWKKLPLTRMYRPTSFNNESSGDSALRTEYSTISDRSTDLHSRFSVPPTVLTNVEEHRISSAVSVKRVTQAEVANMSNIQKFPSKNNSAMKSTHDDNEKEHSVRSQQPVVKVVRVKKAFTMNTTNDFNMNTLPLEISNETRNQTGRVSVSKVQRSKSSNSQLRRRASSADSINVVRVNRSFMEMQPADHRSKASMIIRDRKAITSSAVRVSRVPRRTITAQSGDI